MTQMGEYEVHPAAAILPMMGEDELQELAGDIGANGLWEPIKLSYDKSVLVDGRNRFVACGLAGIAVADIPTEPSPEMTEEETLNFIVSANVKRRQLRHLPQEGDGGSGFGAAVRRGGKGAAARGGRAIWPRPAGKACGELATS